MNITVRPGTKDVIFGPRSDTGWTAFIAVTF